MKTDKLIDEVLIVNVEKTLYRGQALSLSCLNQKGKFDVLPLHSNFISLIYKRLSLVLPNGSQKEFNFNIGALRVKNNRAEAILE